MDRHPRALLAGLMALALTMAVPGCDEMMMAALQQGQSEEGEEGGEEQGAGGGLVSGLEGVSQIVEALSMFGRGGGGGGGGGFKMPAGRLVRGRQPMRMFAPRAGIGLRRQGFGIRRFRSLEDDQGDVTKLPKPPGCPESVLAYEVPNRAAKLFVHCEWDHPDDVNLLVVEPGDEKCWFSNVLTKSGGSMDTDTTGVTGREAYISGDAPPSGAYKIMACHASGKKPFKISVVVQTNARQEGWAAQRYVVQLPAAKGDLFYPVATVELK